MSSTMALWWKCESLLITQQHYVRGKRGYIVVFLRNQGMYPKCQCLSPEVILRSLIENIVKAQFYSPGSLSELAMATKNKQHMQNNNNHNNNNNSHLHRVQSILSF